MALISSVIGTEDKSDYNRTIALPPAINEAAVFIRGVLEEYAFRGRPRSPQGCLRASVACLFVVVTIMLA